MINQHIRSKEMKNTIKINLPFTDYLLFAKPVLFNFLDDVYKIKTRYCYFFLAATGAGPGQAENRRDTPSGNRRNDPEELLIEGERAKKHFQTNSTLSFSIA